MDHGILKATPRQDGESSELFLEEKVDASCSLEYAHLEHSRVGIKT